MNFESTPSMLYSDTAVPDIIITEYMPSMDGDSLKIYLYMTFLRNHKKSATLEDISRVLQINTEKLKELVYNLETLGLIEWRKDTIVLCDMKIKEINKIYRLKSASSPEEALLSTERSKRRSGVITSINNTFFQGAMSPSWYTDIDTWFDRYKFDEDVMMYLFRHCCDHNGLSKNYISKVAESWCSKKICNVFELEKHLEEYKQFKDLRVMIVKKLKLNRNLTEYEEEYIEKWVITFAFGFDIIELALKKTTSKTNPNFKYLNAIVSDWHEKGFKTKEEVFEFEKSRKHQILPNQTKSKVPQETNYEQRKYDDDFYKSLYDNV